MGRRRTRGAQRRLPRGFAGAPLAAALVSAFRSRTPSAVQTLEQWRVFALARSSGKCPTEPPRGHHILERNKVFARLEEVNAYAEVGDVDAAEAVLRQIESSADLFAPELRRVMWNTLLKACANAGRHARAEEYLREMLKKGIELNAKGIGKMMESGAKAGDLDVAGRWLRVRARLFGQDRVSYIMMMEAAATGGDLHAAEHWFGEMLRARLAPCALSLNCLIDAAAKSNNLTAAEFWMEQATRAGIRPNRELMTSIIAAAANSGDLTSAERWQGTAQARGVSEDTVSFTVLVSAAAKAGNLLAAEEHFKRGVEASLRPNTLTLNALVDAAAKAGDASAAEHWYAACRTAGIKPDVITFTALINAAGKHAAKRPVDVGGPSQAEHWLWEAVRERVQPDAVMLTALINSAASSGNFSGAEHWVGRASKARVRLNAFAYASLVSAAARQSNLEVAEDWFERQRQAGVRPGAVAYTALIQAAGRCQQHEAAAARFLELAATDPRAVDRTLALAVCRVVGQDSFAGLCQEAGLDAEELMRQGPRARGHGRRDRASLTGAALDRARSRGALNQRRA
uniref:Pentacotripeptide-repeat region of PRORP domain-containing protein n=1 Tax=Alexandrium monilatum TaxID=311494 RepID=A0A7S4RES1_9DINO